MRVVLLTVLVACGSGDRPDAATPKEAAVDCAGAAATGALLADEPSRESVRAVIAIRCTEDKWPATAATCIVNAKDRDAAHHCVHDQLTGAQADRLMHDVQAAVDTSVTPTDTTPTAPPDETSERTGPLVTDIYPSRGELAGGTYVVLRGIEFTNEARSAKVRFGGKDATVVRFQSDTELIVQSPAGTGTVDVVVTFTPGGERTLPGAFTYANPPAAKAKKGSSQAQLAEDANKEGEALMQKQKYDEAAEKFRDAAARTNEPHYFLNLCGAYYHGGRFSQALVACNNVVNSSPTPQQAARADALIATIQAEAKRQGLDIQPQ
jgi:hypothetical protein